MGGGGEVVDEGDVCGVGLRDTHVLEVVLACVDQRG